MSPSWKGTPAVLGLALTAFMLSLEVRTQVLGAAWTSREPVERAVVPLRVTSFKQLCPCRVMLLVCLTPGQRAPSCRCMHNGRRRPRRRRRPSAIQRFCRTYRAYGILSAGPSVKHHSPRHSVLLMSACASAGIALLEIYWERNKKRIHFI